MGVRILSDLHIQGPSDPLYFSLLSILSKQSQKGDIVVLAGDIFDLLVGNKPIFTQRYSRFFEELKSAGRRGVVLHYIEGNHDFLLRKTFKQIPAVRLHTQQLVLNYENKRFYIAHGDLVNRWDYRYRILRVVLRSPLMRGLLFMTPGAWLDRVGTHSSRYSSRRNPRLPTHLPASQMEKLRRVFRSYAAELMRSGYDFVVLGHCHDLDEMKFLVGNKKTQYINMGYPRIHGSYLVWLPGDDTIHREPLPSTHTSTSHARD